VLFNESPSGHEHLISAPHLKSAKTAANSIEKAMKLLNHSSFDSSTRETSRVSKTTSLIVVNHPPAKRSFSMFFLRIYFCSFLRRLSFQIALNSILHSNRRGNFSNFQMALGRSPCTKDGYQ